MQPRKASSARRILVVEDDPDASDLVRMGLERRGFVVDVAETVSEAREHVASHHYDVLLSDLHLPDGDGRELAEASQEIAVRLLLSGDRVEPGSLGDAVTEQLQKPMSVGRIAERIEHWLSRETPS